MVSGELILFALVFIVGASLGSFLTVLSDRLPKGQNVLTGRSRCDFCHKNLRWFELIPIFSWIIQCGRCRRCHNALSLQYPILEIVSGVSFVMLFVLFFSYGLMVFLSSCLLFASFFVIFVSDLHYQIIPDSMIVMGFVASMLLAVSHNFSLFDYMARLVVGAGASAFFGLLWLLTRGRGMGLGDVKLAFLLGILTGIPQVIVLLYGAFLTGAVSGVILICSGKKSWKSKLAFGPFLLIGYMISLVWGETFISWWQHML